MHIYTARKPMDGDKELLNGKLLIIRNVKDGSNAGGVDIIDICAKTILRRTTRVMEKKLTEDGITFKTASGAEYDFVNVSTLIPTYVKPEPLSTEENPVKETPKENVIPMPTSDETESPAVDRYVSPVTFRDLFDYIQTANRNSTGEHRRDYNDDFLMHIYNNLHQVNILTDLRQNDPHPGTSLINFVFTEDENDLKVKVVRVSSSGVADYDHPEEYDASDLIEDCRMLQTVLRDSIHGGEIKVYLIDVLETYVREREAWKELNVVVLSEDYSIRPAHYCDALKRVDYKLSRDLTREEFIKFCELKHRITNEASLHPYGPYAKFEGSGNMWSHITVEPYTD